MRINKRLLPFIAVLGLVALFLASFAPAISHAQSSGGNIGTIDQFTSTTSPVTAITQRIFGRAIKITGLSDGCLSLVSSLLTSSGSACGSGGGSNKIATSSAEVSGRIPFWTSNSGTPATLSGGSSAFTWDNTLSKLTVTNASTTNLTIGALSGILKASAGTVSTAVSGTDYAPATSGSSLLYGNGAGGFSNASIGTGLSFVGGTLSATGGGGSGSSPWATTTSTVPGNLIIYPLNNSDTVTVGSTSTSTAPVYFDPNTLINYFKGRVGIGTTTPGAQLHIDGGATSGSSIIVQSSLASAGNTVTLSADVGTAAFSYNGSATINTNLANIPSAFRISSNAQATGGINIYTQNATAPIRFGTASSAFANERMRITPAGLVGIGTTSPSSLLNLSASDTGTTITSASAAMLDVTNSNTTDNNFSDLAFSTADSVGAPAVTSKIVGVNTVHTAGATSGDTAFLTRSAGTLSEKMRILSSGNVGIGTTTPARKLVIAALGGTQLALYSTDTAKEFRIGVGNNSGTAFNIIESGVAEQFTILAGGRTGIGSSTPGSILSVGSTNGINFSTATSTFSSTGGINLTSGCFAIAGVCIGSGAGTVTSVTGTYPVISSGGATPAISLAFGTTTANTWGPTQTFTLSPVFSTLGAGTVNSTTGGTLYATGTSTPTVTAPITYSGTLGSFVGGVSGAFDCTSATGSVKGCLTAADWTTFNSKISSTSLSATSPLTYNSATGVIAIPAAASGQSGYLTSADWSLFNNKISSTSLSTTLGLGYVPSTGVFSIATSSLFTGSTGQVAYFAGTNAPVGTSTLFIAPSSRVGVGNTVPDAMLTITTATTTSFQAPRAGTMLHIVNDSVNNARLEVDTFLAGGTNGSIFQGRRANGVQNTPTAATTDQILAAFAGDGYRTTGYGLTSPGSMSIKASGTFTDTSAPTYITFGTTPSASITSVERLRITSAGLVGIGTTTPGRALSVQGSANLSGDLFAANITATGTTATANLTIGSLSGILKATAGVVSTAISGTDYAPAGAYITALTGDVTASGPGSAAATLATVNSNVGSFNNVTVNAKGLVTAASSVSYENPLTFTYPLTRSTNTIALAFGTTTANTWSQIQTFTAGFVNNATSTGSAGFNISGGCYAISGVCIGSGAVASVSNADGTLTISPTTGAVVASLALGHANTWTGAQSFAPNTLKVNDVGASGGVLTINLASTASSFTATFPAATGTVLLDSAAQTVTNKTFALGSNTLTGTSAQLATGISDETGSGLLVFGSSPSLLTPTLTNPKISSSIFDSNGNAIVTFSPTASAVSYVLIANAAAGGVPRIASNSGAVNLDVGGSGGHLILTGDGTGTAADGLTISLAGGSRPSIFPTATNTGIDFNANGTGNILFRNSGTGNVGISTTSPFTLLAVAGTITANNINATSTTATSLFSGTLQVLTHLIGVISSSLSLTTDGEMGTDSTSNQFEVRSNGVTRVIGNGNFYPAFTLSTTTAWTGTTTVPLGPSYVGETWNGIQCFTDTGTLVVNVTDGTNRMNAANASTTVGTTALNSNNTFVAAEKRYVELGTPGSSPTAVSCTVSKSITAD